ncbi:MAG: hypothetical protein WD317_04420 [Balneolaceae bacterium]
MEQNKPFLPAVDDFLNEYKSGKRLLLAVLVSTLGIAIAGFWNYHLVDGFGRDFIAGRTIGNTSMLAGSFGENGGGFGFVFAAIAGLAATFTACNCVAFAMVPGLACSANEPSARIPVSRVLMSFVTPVVLLSIAYGGFIGFLGPDGVASFNERPIRIAQARIVFSVIGMIMLFWGLLEMGYLKSVTHRFSRVTLDFFSLHTTKAVIMGILVGLFAIGRPFPVFREFLTYAATAESPLYGAAVMSVHGIGQIAVLLVLFLALFYFSGNRLLLWVNRKPHQARLLTALSLLCGGSYFLFYWGIAFIYDIGRWGFKLGWY